MYIDVVYHLFQHKPCVGELVQQVEIMVNGETLSIFISSLPQDIEYSALLLFFCQLLLIRTILGNWA